MIRTAQDQNGNGVPVGRLNADGAVRVVFDDTASTSTEAMPAGVYLVSMSAGAFVRIAADGDAGALAGSFVLGAGGGGYFRIADGDKVHVRGMSGQAGAAYIVPLENA